MNINNNLGLVVNDNSFLRTQLRNNNQNLNFAHLNCGSFNLCRNSVKLNEIRNIFEDSSLDIIGISETWLQSVILTNAVNISGYNCCRNDRPDKKKGGGVCFYVSKKLDYKIVFSSKLYNIAESLFIEINYGGKQFLVGVVYLPRGLKKNLRKFEKSVSDLIVKYENIVIMGDMNFNMFESKKSVLIRNLCKRLNISCFHNALPTHFDIKTRTTSLLDYFLVSHPNLIQNSGQLQCPGVSHHSLIYISLYVPFEKMDDIVEYYDYNLVNSVLLENLALSCDFTDIYTTSDVDQQLHVLSRNLDAAHAAVPLVRRKLVNNGETWMKSDDIRYSISMRDLAYSAFCSDRTDENWKIYCRIRNRTKSLIRKAKRLAHCRIFNGLSSKQLWNVLRNNGVANDGMYANPIDVFSLNEIFVSNQLDEVVDIDYDTICFRDDGFSFRCVEFDELLRQLYEIKSNATGCDGYCLKFLKIVIPYFGSHILHLVNTILTTSRFPKSWKVARIVPIRKHGDSSEPENLRPISVLPVLSKVVEGIMKKQINSFLNDNSLLNHSQYGFRSGHSTSSLLVGLTDTIRTNLSSGNFCILLSLDLTKAFDKVSHNLLLKKLIEFYSFSRSATFLISDYFLDRGQFVFSRGESSEVLPIKSGVPQGSVLGPILFTMFLNDFFSSLNVGKCYLFGYADDIQILFCGKRQFIDVFQSIVNNGTKCIYDWMTCNHLSINALKTKAMLFSPSRNCNPKITVSIDNVVVEFVDRLKILGVIVDNKLSFESHISHLASTVNFSLMRLYSNNLSLPLHVKEKVVHSLIMPMFLYCIEVYTGTVGYNIGKLYMLFKRVMRYLYSLRGRSHVSIYVEKFLGTSFFDFIKIRLLLHLYSIFRNGFPTFLLNLFTFTKCSRSYQIIPPLNSSWLERSYQVRVIRSFNSLPVNLRRFDQTYHVHRNKLLTYSCSNKVL